MCFMGKFSNLSKEILDSAAEELEISVVSQRCQRVLVKEGYYGIERIVVEDRKRRARARIKVLESRKLIEVKKIGENLIVSLTLKGREKAIRQHIAESHSPTNTINTLVSYDIPEHARNSRDVFRRFLKSVGFKKIHDSLWISESDTSALLEEWINESKFKKWITVFKVIKGI